MSAVTEDAGTGLGTIPVGDLSEEDRAAFASVGIELGDEVSVEQLEEARAGAAEAPVQGEEDPDVRYARQMAEQAERMGTAGEPAVPVENVAVRGTVQLGLFNAGGKAPTGATITLSGGQFALIEMQAFEKGDVISFSGTAVVREVGQVDQADSKTGQVISCNQKHVARILDLVVAPAEES